jgi:hypothetical protein
LWKRGLLEHDRLTRIDWSWLSLDGAMTDALAGSRKRTPSAAHTRSPFHRHRSRARCATGLASASLKTSCSSAGVRF